MSKKKHTIIGVVVLYNPTVNILQNIATYLSYLDTLYVLDNSEEPAQAIVDKIRSLSNCVYINSQQNLGIAAALNIAAKKAIYDSATWLLTMDQDSFFNDDDCLRLVNYALGLNDNEVGIVSPLQSSYLEEYRPETLSEEPFTVITSGNLISLAAYRKVGGFNEKYFIDAVDTEYCLRLHQQRFKIKRMNTIVLQHNLGTTSIHKTFLQKNIIVRNHNKFRRFYMARNGLDLAFRSIFTYPRFAIAIVKNIFVDMKNILCYEDQKIDKIRYTLRGFLAFFRDEWGKVDE